VITVVLDDDPTGAQAMSGVSVILDWQDPDAWRSVEPGDRAVHLLTNSRAHDGVGAATLVASAARAARMRRPDCRLVLRGDSTLRAHLWEEYEALRAVVEPDRADVPHLLVPALPAAGRVTVGGVQLLERDGRRIPLDRTEYANDGALAYTSAELAFWAEERSAGRFAAADAVTVPLEALRSTAGASRVAAAIAAAAQTGRPAVVVPDAEDERDLETIADGLRIHEATSESVVVRCAPAFAAVLSGAAARAAPAAPSGDRGVLIVCGSFVPTTTAQVEQLEREHPGVTVPARVAALAGAHSEAEIERVSETARARIETHGLAAVVTERVRDPGLADPAGQRRAAAALAEVTRHVDAGVVIAKGGITSAVIARDGLGARAARVLGPVRPGVALWKLADGRDYLVVPGNVGGPELLAELVAAILLPVARC
jgi:uncharacterized protein YgbK (DUF1537 family)